MNKELEIKIQVSENAFQKILEKFISEVELKGKEEQTDIYYSPENINFYNQGEECLRLRIEEERKKLSYKKIHHPNSGNRYIEEYETDISDVEMLDKILCSLKFKPEIIVKKERQEFYYPPFSLVAFDKVENLGYFIEVENINETDTIENRNRQLRTAIQELGLDITNQNFEGYSNMLYRNKQK